MSEPTTAGRAIADYFLHYPVRLDPSLSFPSGSPVLASGSSRSKTPRKSKHSREDESSRSGLSKHGKGARSGLLRSFPSRSSSLQPTLDQPIRTPSRSPHSSSFSALPSPSRSEKQPKQFPSPLSNDPSSSASFSPRPPVPGPLTSSTLSGTSRFSLTTLKDPTDDRSNPLEKSSALRSIDHVLARTGMGGEQPALREPKKVSRDFREEEQRTTPQKHGVDRNSPSSLFHPVKDPPVLLASAPSFQPCAPETASLDPLETSTSNRVPAASTIPSINDIIKHNLAKEAASPQRSHPLPSAFSPVPAEKQKRFETLGSSELTLSNSTSKRSRDVKLASWGWSYLGPPTYSESLASLPVQSESVSPASDTAALLPHASLPPSPTEDKPLDFDHALLLRSARLNRMMTLQTPLYQNHKVSFSDVGSLSGHPIFIFLGLGGVRYLTALFEDLATTLGLRLICVDRWGLGRTDDIPAERRGFLEWANVVKEVADGLGMQKFGVLAHSAGTPYAMAVAWRFPESVVGSVSLLAPWVGLDIDGGYKWLKYVPTTIIKATQAAEWKMQGWMLGKPLSTLTPTPSLSSPSLFTEEPSSGSTEPKLDPGMTDPFQSDPPSVEPSEPKIKIGLGTALLRACHAENTTGAQDLLAIMKKPAEWGFDYADVKANVRVWYGDRDDRINERSVRWMERTLPRCELIVKPGEGHNLLSSTAVVIEVFDRLVDDLQEGIV